MRHNAAVKPPETVDVKNEWDVAIEGFGAINTSPQATGR
jgi:hypothetical protein